MSRFDAAPFMRRPLRTGLRPWLGILRSVWLYHGRRRHRTGLVKLYRGFVAPGELAFDIGAHVGDRTSAFLALGARVVAVEPQPRLIKVLRFAFGHRPAATLAQVAVSDFPGRLVLSVNTANPTVSTASQDLVAAAPKHASWNGQVWDERVEVEATTLDMLITRHGEPAFVKIDVEGLEDRVLAGLSRPVRSLSFEFTTLQRDVALRALERTEALGYRRYAVSLGESHVMVHQEMLNAAAIRHFVENLPDEANSGDIYCFREG